MIILPQIKQVGKLPQNLYTHITLETQISSYRNEAVFKTASFIW
jgi:hypothetical protein